jgi:hypothetical protein
VIGLARLLIRVVAAGALAAIAVCAPPLRAAPASPQAADRPSHPVPTLAVKKRDGDPTRFIVEVSGLQRDNVRALGKTEMTPERWQSFLVVRVLREDGNAADDSPPVLGTYRVDGNVLRFEPKFPMEPGVRYQAEFYPLVLQALTSPRPRADVNSERTLRDRFKLAAEFCEPRPPATPTATVTAVYPTRSVLPENLLRFYIHFSAPMSRGEAYRHIRLLDATGKPVEDPFLELDEELWSGDGKRFTLLFDPGRIKRGLKPREEVGPILEAGRSYELVIDPGWSDAAGHPLKAGFRKRFQAGPADEASPDPKAWVVRPPAPSTRAPLEVRYPEPLDRALLDRLIAVRDGSDRPVAGSISVSDEETSWRFAPDAPWRPGSYRLVIGTELEDVAGNSVARPFEVDAVGPISRRIVGETVELPLRIGPASR